MTGASRAAGLGVLLAVGSPALEDRLGDGLAAQGIRVVGRSLDGATLLAAAAGDPSTRPHAVIATATLHGLDEATLAALQAARVPVLLLAAEERQVERFAALADVLPLATPADAVAAAVRGLTDGRDAEHVDHASAAPGRGAVYAAPEVPSRRGRVLLVTSGKGAPGKTTAAIAIAAAVARDGGTPALLDADLRGGNVAPALGLDPRRGLVALAGGGTTAPTQQAEGIAVVVGLERPEQAAALPADALTTTAAALRERHALVVIDAGTPAAPALLRVADQVLFVVAPDLVSLWNARVGVRSVRDAVLGEARVLVNRREGREHYDAREVEQALGLPVLGTVREDRAAARRAVDAQAPLVAIGGDAADDLGRAARLLSGTSAPTTTGSRGTAGWWRREHAREATS